MAAGGRPGAGMARPRVSRRSLRVAAERTLRANDRGGWTVPSPAQYPHQWNWDSGFAALGWSIIDPARAAREVESLLLGRWREGMVPHVRYNPQALEDYFPGPDWWPGAASRVEIGGSLTSGISNPPVAVLAACRAGGRLPGPERAAFWGRVLPPLGRWLRWFLDARRLPGWGLPASVHPWETGWDNSPRWDFLRPAGLRPRRPYRRLDARRVPAAQRPGDLDYDAYLALAELLDGCGYDLRRYRAASPFLVHDVVTDAIWYRAAVELSDACATLGAASPIDSGELREFAAAFDEVHWDGEAQTYLDFDIQAGRRIRVPTAAGAAALVAGLASADRASAVWRGAPRAAGPPVPTVDSGDEAFDRRLYWRGPVWVNVNWLVAEGLQRCGLAGDAAGLRRSTLDLLDRAGFAEYFDALDGSPLGIAGFSWSAALALDLLASERD